MPPGQAARPARIRPVRCSRHLRGGGLAQQVAFQHPRRCRRLVLVSTATGALMIPANPWCSADGHPPPLPRPRLRHLDRRPAVRRPAPRRTRVARTLLHQHLRVGSGCGYLLQLLAGVGWTSLPALPLLRQPTLILAGSDDPIIPLANARIMARLLPDATLHIYDDGHLGLVTGAHGLAPLITDFLLTLHDWRTRRHDHVTPCLFAPSTSSALSTRTRPSPAPRSSRYPRFSRHADAMQAACAQGRPTRRVAPVDHGVRRRHRVGRRRASRPAADPTAGALREGAHLTPALPDMTIRELRADY